MVGLDSNQDFEAPQATVFPLHHRPRPSQSLIVVGIKSSQWDLNSQPPDFFFHCYGVKTYNITTILIFSFDDKQLNDNCLRKIFDFFYSWQRIPNWFLRKSAFALITHILFSNMRYLSNIQKILSESGVLNQIRPWEHDGDNFPVNPYFSLRQSLGCFW